MNEFCEYTTDIVDIPDEVLNQWAEERLAEEEYIESLNEYLDSEMAEEYYINSIECIHM